MIRYHFRGKGATRPEPLVHLTIKLYHLGGNSTSKTLLTYILLITPMCKLLIIFTLLSYIVINFIVSNINGVITTFTGIPNDILTIYFILQKVSLGVNPHRDAIPNDTNDTNDTFFCLGGK